MRRIELCEKSCAGSTDDQPEVCRCEPDCELDAEVKRLREGIKQKNYQIENWKWELDKRMCPIDFKALVEEMKKNE